MNLSQTLDPEYIRNQKLKIAQERSAADTKRRSMAIIAKYKRGELQSFKTVSKAGLLHTIQKQVVEINGWKRYTRFSYVADPEKHQLILTPCKDTNSNHTLVLCANHTITICRSVCTLAGWDGGDIINIVFKGKQAIMERVKSAEKMQGAQEKPEKVNHIRNDGRFSLNPDRVIAKNNGWCIGTRFSCNAEDGRIVLEESESGDRKINGQLGLIAIPKSMCQSAGLVKRDPVTVSYEGRQIIIARA